MLLPNPDRSTKPRHYAYRKMVSRALGFWHRGSAWILGPLLVGLTAVGVAFGAEYATTVNRWLFSTFPLAPLVILPTGFALIAWLTRRYFPGTQGSGIPQTMAAINDLGPAKRHDLLSPKIAIGKILLTLGGLAAGASIGREGPTVQIGASIMNMFHGRGPFKSIGQRRIFLLAGGAAGIAAAFNTPLAGIMFAIEELSKKHVFNANSSTLITVIGSGLISLALLGNYTYFGTTGASLEWHSSVFAIALCGVIGGAGGGVFSRLLLAATFRMPARIGGYAKARPFAFAAACGFVLAILGLSTHGLVFGTGYDQTRLSLEYSGTLPWHFGFA
jgi:H+/Cl- antiporter ClcA